MSYRTILVHVNESKHNYDRIRLAAAMAKRFHAHLVGVAATALPGAYYLPGVFGESSVSLSAYLDMLKEQAENALAEFEGVARDVGVESFEKRIVEDEAGAGVSLHARYSDLAVIGQIDPDETLPSLRKDFPEYVVMNSGCPTLAVPYAGRFADFGKRVMIAWNGSMEAARAVAGSVPVLKMADEVQIVALRRKTDPEEESRRSTAALVPFLKRHGIEAAVSLQAAASNVDMGNLLLSQAADLSADMLVMGCYGHSRFREVLLGGVTQTVLESMTIPVLMSH